MFLATRLHITISLMRYLKIRQNRAILLSVTLCNGDYNTRELFLSIIRFKELLILSGDKKEFGDYQTPIEFCDRVCAYLDEQGLSRNIEAIIEPTCGLGNFIVSAFENFHLPAIGIDINNSYIKTAHERLPSGTFINDNIFDVDVSDICRYRNVLVIGNPPWATNSDLDYNLPQKVNFKGLKGIEALTGSSNFDICEYVILQMLNAFKGTDSVICMLCKTSVARNVILEIDRNSIPCNSIEMLNFNSQKVFGVSAAACVLVIHLSSALNTTVACHVKDIDSLATIDTLTINNHHLVSSDRNAQDFEGTCQMTWRSGVKHDCGKVMELELVNGNYVNKYKEVVEVEDDLVFPLVKSSLFKSPIISDFKKYVIVTQQRAKQDTSYIEQEYPHLWSYLNSHSEDFSKRKSIIYKKSGSFSMFGVGDYSFAPYKVGVSGFYKKPLFSLLTADKPVMTDDTSYFLSFDNYDDAYTMMLLLNSQPVQKYLTSIAFLDSKRPYTVKLLSRLDLKKCIQCVSFVDLEQTEIIYELNKRLTPQMVRNLKRKIC